MKIFKNFNTFKLIKNLWKKIICFNEMVCLFSYYFLFYQKEDEKQRYFIHSLFLMRFCKKVIFVCFDGSFCSRWRMLWWLFRIKEKIKLTFWISILYLVQNNPTHLQPRISLKNQTQNHIYTNKPKMAAPLGIKLKIYLTNSLQLWLSQGSSSSLFSNDSWANYFLKLELTDKLTDKLRWWMRN